MNDETSGEKYTLDEVQHQTALNHSPRAFCAEILYQEVNYDVVNPKRMNLESDLDLRSIIEDLDTYSEEGLLDRSQKGGATPNYWLTRKGREVMESQELGATHLLSDSEQERLGLIAD